MDINQNPRVRKWQLQGILIFSALVLFAGCAEKQQAALQLEQELLSASEQSIPAVENQYEESGAADEDVSEPAESAVEGKDESHGEEQGGLPEVNSADTPGNQSGADQGSDVSDVAPLAEEISVHGGMPSRPNQPYYTVQIASTPSREYADEVAALWVERGLQPFVQEVDRDGTPFYRVRLGRFETRSEASDFSTMLSDKYDVAGWVDREQ